MENINIAWTISQMLPDAQFAIVDNDLSKIDWHSPNINCPTMAEIQSFHNKHRYRELRRAEYPPISEQLDALWKGGDEHVVMLKKIRSIKEKYPKN